MLFASNSLGQTVDNNRSGDDGLRSGDVSGNFKYPYQVSDERKQKFIDILNEFKDPFPLSDLLIKLGKPDRVDDLSKESKPLSHFESGFMSGSVGRFSYRCIWFARKASASPGLGDSWIAAYVDKDEKTVSVIHNNWLKK